MERQANASHTATGTQAATTPGSGGVADRLAALKARVAAAVGNKKSNDLQPTGEAKGGLAVGLHPALEDLSQWRPSTRTSELPSNAGNASKRLQHVDSAASLNKRRRLDASTAQAVPGAQRANPYIDANATGGTGLASKQRQPKPLVFNPKGKYIQQGNALRRQAALELTKRRIAEQTRKAGIDEDLDTEKNFVVEAPPDVEWFDEGLVDGKNYDDIEDSALVKITGSDSIVTEYIQHPVAIEPPQDQLVPAAKAMPLTTKEQKKLRRQRRAEVHKQEQAMIRLGLVPAPAPKVKKGNLMRVLGEEAVADPTAVEARVEREIAERYQKHMEANEERKLTKEQRHEKLAANQEKDAAKGIHVLVFKIGSLVNGQHRFKIGKNAKNHALTGICVMHPKFNLVIVEGGEHSIVKYKKLMLNRIDWTENKAPLPDRDGAQAAARDWLKAEDEKGSLKDTSHNECKLIWEGEAKNRVFRQWSTKVCETDAEAREALSRTKMESFWTQAKSIS